MIYPKKSVKNAERNGKGSAERMRIKKIYRVEMNNSGMPNFSTAEEVQTKQVKYFDEDEKVWKIGEVL